MINKICQKKHRDLPKYSTLRDAQDNQNGGRHICAGCAYVEGLKDALSKNGKKQDLSYLPFSQAKRVRHKDAYEAYDLGYDEGIELDT